MRQLAITLGILGVLVGVAASTCRGIAGVMYERNDPWSGRLFQSAFEWLMTAAVWLLGSADVIAEISTHSP